MHYGDNPIAALIGEHLDWFAKQPEVRDCLAMMAALFEALAREDASQEEASKH